MTAITPTSLDAALRRPLWLALGGALLLAIEWLIGPWSVGSLPLALIALAAGGALLLRSLNADSHLEPEEEGADEVCALLQRARVLRALAVDFEFDRPRPQVHPHVNLHLLRHRRVQFHPAVLQRRQPVRRHGHAAEARLARPRRLLHPERGERHTCVTPLPSP